MSASWKRFPDNPLLPGEVIVANKGSTDCSADTVRRFAAVHPCFKLVDAFERRGASAACNVGARFATGDVLAFCDADDGVALDRIAGLQKGSRRSRLRRESIRPDEA